MTDEDKKLVFEYMGWRMPCDGNEANRFACLTEGEITCIKCEYYHPLDGNDMVAAMNKMVENKELWGLDSFLDYMQDTYFNEYIGLDDENFIHWLMQPARFFELMLSWLKEKEHEKS